jgi:hypothetical protein
LPLEELPALGVIGFGSLAVHVSVSSDFRDVAWNWALMPGCVKRVSHQMPIGIRIATRSPTMSK